MRIWVLALACVLAFPCAALADPAQYVNPLSGTLGSGFPMVGASVPFGQIQPGPDTSMPDGSDDPVNYCGYAFQDPAIRGFSLTHFDGAGVMIAGDVPFMPTTGDVSADSSANTSPYEHATEVAQPGYYAVTLAKYQTRVELTSALRASMARITFPSGGSDHIVIDPTRSIGHTSKGSVSTVGNNEIVGSSTSPDDYTVYFAMQFDQPFTAAHGTGPTVLDFAGPVVTMRMAISYVDVDGARGNLAAPPKRAFDFDGMRDAARKTWNDRLDSIKVSGGSTGLTKTFYSNLYRFFLMPSVLDDADGRYPGMDNGAIHTVDPGTHQYTALSLWDTYRTEFPLLSLVAPDVARDVARSILNDYDQNGRQLPRWVQANRDQQIMGGDSATATLGDAVGEGLLDDTDGQRATAAMLNDATRVPHVSAREGVEGYMQRGWVGQDETGRSGAALTLEYAIDDAAMLPALRAYAPDQVDAFAKRASNWKNLWSADDTFLRPRNKDGSWASPNPLGIPGVWRPEFQDGWQEGTGYQYLWFVPQDVTGLAKTLGGNDAATKRLDDFFRAPAPVQDKGSFFGAYYIGTQFTPSNETDLWAPWYYDWLGQPWKAQREAHQAMSVYSWRPDGMPGNDDTGTMAAWYVLASLGLYHAAPGSQAWELSSPAFPKATVGLGGRHKLVITADNASRVDKFIQSASVDQPWLSSQKLRAGGKLHFVLGPLPNRNWGTTAPAPPSLSR